MCFAYASALAMHGLEALAMLVCCALAICTVWRLGYALLYACSQCTAWRLIGLAYMLGYASGVSGAYRRA